MFSDASLQQLRDRINLIEVLERFLTLKRSGASYKTHCPFHEEKTPSFLIKQGDTHYHCFGCGAHGDAIAFLMHYQHLSFQEAVETLAELFHVPLEKQEGKKEEVSLALLKQTLELAGEFYHFYLLHSQEGHQALDYLFRRQISLEFIKRFKLGFAPFKEGLFLKWMKHEKMDRSLLIDAGLLHASGREFFQGRILFPVHNARGGLVGFSARKILEETFGGKYINTPETLLFKKSRLLFGLHLTRRQIAKQKQVIIVEGQIDCLKLIEAGFDWTVASLGTAFGAAHITELTHLGVIKAILLFDSDDAGLAAAAKVGDLFQSVGVEVSVVILPAGTDPDSFLKQQGKAALQEKIEQGINYLSFQLNQLLQQAGDLTPAAKSHAINTLTKQIKNWKEPVMVHETLKRLSELTDVPPHMLGVMPLKQAPVKSTTVDFDRILEIELIRWLVLCGQKRPDFVAAAKYYVSPTCLHTDACRKFYESYLAGVQDVLLLGMHHPDMIDEIMERKVNLDQAEKYFLQTLQKLVDRTWMAERESLTHAIGHATEKQEDVQQLIKRFDALGKQRPIVSLSQVV